MFDNKEPEIRHSETPDGYSRETFSDAYAIRKAERTGCTIEYADDHTLQLDLDSDEADYIYDKQLRLLDELGIIHILKLTERRSKSDNWHITITLRDPLSIEVRILLQACLGSDIKRELLSYAGYLKGQTRPVLLFRPKEG